MVPGIVSQDMRDSIRGAPSWTYKSYISFGESSDLRLPFLVRMHRDIIQARINFLSSSDESPGDILRRYIGPTSPGEPLCGSSGRASTGPAWDKDWRGSGERISITGGKDRPETSPGPQGKGLYVPENPKIPGRLERSLLRSRLLPSIRTHIHTFIAWQLYCVNQWHSWTRLERERKEEGRGGGTAQVIFLL